MKLIGFTNWKDERYIAFEYPEDRTEEEEAWVLTVKYMRNHGLRFPGYYHQGGDYGAPVFDNGKKLTVSFRGWGSLMAEVLELSKDEKDGRDMSYCDWAWAAEENECVFPTGEMCIEKEEGQNL